MSEALPKNEDGSVNWRAIIKPEHLYVKTESREAVAKLLDKPVAEVRNLGPEDIAKLPDQHLVIKKAGILALAKARGYTAVNARVAHAQRDYVVSEATIDWEGGVRTAAVGDAHVGNCSELGALYLGPMSFNRAFALCVRNHLGIDIVSSDELGGKGVEPESVAQSTGQVTPENELAKAASDAGFSFDQVRNAAQTRWNEDTQSLASDANFRRRIENDPAPWKTWTEVPKRDCLTLIGLIRAAHAAKTEQKSVKKSR